MIRGALRLEDRRLGATVLLRDAVRNARRWQTYALRTLFSAVLMALFLAVVWVATSVGQRWLDPASVGKSARYVFITFAVVQVIVASMVAPLAVASAVIEEREQNTADLLLLTRISAKRIFVGKVTAKLLLLLLVVLGAMPVQALVTTLGGVSVFEVVAVTTHALLATVLLGAMGGFFAIFTRSPLVAALAALSYGLFTFVAMPLFYGTLTADPSGMVMFTPLFATTAQDARALVPVLSYLPVLWLLRTLGARFYDLRLSGATLRRFIATDAWSASAFIAVTVVVAATGVSLLPFGVVGSYYAAIATIGAASSGTALVGAISRVVVWAWGVGFLLVCSWAYLRIAMDVVLMTDDALGIRRPQGAGASRAVWRNPVLWRGLRGRAWSAFAPTIGLWVVGALIAAYSMLWVIPGVLLVMGGGAALAAIVLTLWMGAHAIEDERRAGTLGVLLTTPMRSASIVGAKLLGVAVPTSGLLVAALPVVVAGAWYTHVLFAFADRGSFGGALLVGLMGSVWLVGLWLLALTGSLFLALALPRPKAAYPIGLGLLVTLLVVPPTLSAFTRGMPWLAAPFRLMNPVMVSHPSALEIALSLVGLLLASGVLFVVSCVKLRDWGMRHD